MFITSANDFEEVLWYPRLSVPMYACLSVGIAQTVSYRQIWTQLCEMITFWTDIDPGTVMPLLQHWEIGRFSVLNKITQKVVSEYWWTKEDERYKCWSWHVGAYFTSSGELTHKARVKLLHFGARSINVDKCKNCLNLNALLSS